jgi:hypothetical protein
LNDSVDLRLCEHGSGILPGTEMKVELTIHSIKALYFDPSADPELTSLKTI